MPPLDNPFQWLQDLLAHVPDILQPIMVALIGAIPFVEGEGGAVVGVLGGMNPIIAGVAAAVGNFLCVLLIVTLGARIRAAAVARRAEKRVAVTAGAADADAPEATPARKPESKGRERFRRYLVRFGVPGASLIGPLAMPTQFTSALLVAGGVSKSWVLLWQAIAIVLWTAFATVSSWGALTLLYNIG